MKITLESMSRYCTSDGDCLLWDLGCNSSGYPIARLDGKIQLVRRYVYFDLMGHAPRKIGIASKCGRPTCIAPACIKPSTRSQILTEAYRAGKRDLTRERMIKRMNAINDGRAKLSQMIATAIRGELAGMRTEDAARMYGVSPSAIRKVRAYVTWDDRPHPGSSVFAWAASA